jgi:hypothetical protein
MSNRDLLLTEIYFLINLDKDFSADFAIVRKFKLIALMHWPTMHTVLT